MVSYADFITLLFAFFVVMYAISSINEGKYKELTQSIGDAFRFRAPTTVSPEPQQAVAIPPELIRPITRRTPTSAEVRRERERMTEIGRDLMQVLSPLIHEGKVRVLQSPRGVNVEINASVLFATADARLSRQSEEVLISIARILQSTTNDIQVEGFTDSVPISTSQFPSNWELSSARASSVVRLFSDNGISSSRMVVIGRGENLPIDENTSAEGRQRNRRVSLTVLTSLPDSVTEIPVSH
jgi:chemotaxis protein MotB